MNIISGKRFYISINDEKKFFYYKFTIIVIIRLIFFFIREKVLEEKFSSENKGDALLNFDK